MLYYCLFYSLNFGVKYDLDLFFFFIFYKIPSNTAWVSADSAVCVWYGGYAHAPHGRTTCLF